ncbi:hypothetical protein LUU34_00093500 [Aix galericulata]|nr:hypothetical protein LUU34_00093500 [Aix galericulata]
MHAYLTSPIAASVPIEPMAQGTCLISLVESEAILDHESHVACMHLLTISLRSTRGKRGKLWNKADFVVRLSAHVRAPAVQWYRVPGSVEQSIIYIRDYNSRHQEVSAYIDYAYRLTTDDFEAYFSGKKRLLPRKTDLSFYNWNKNVVSSNPSPNYEVIAENACGLLFKNKMDGKIINVNPKVYPGDNTTRTPVKTNLYLHMVIYDHIVGREP